MGRAGALTGYDVLCHGAAFLHDLHLVHDGTRGTDLDACPAETASGFLQGLSLRNTCADPCVCLNIIQHLYAAKVLTGADTSPAADTSGEQVGYQGIAVVIGNTSGFLPPALRADAHVLVHGLEFASAIFGTARAVCGMGCQNQLHGHFPDLLRFRTVDPDTHAFLCHGFTCRDRPAAAFDFHGAQAAASLGFKVRMVAEMGDENIGSQGSLKHGLALFCFYFFSVYCNLHYFTPVSGRVSLVSVLKPIQLRRRVLACNASAVQAEAHGVARKDKWIAVTKNIACVRSHAV